MQGIEHHPPQPGPIPVPDVGPVNPHFPARRRQPLQLRLPHRSPRNTHAPNLQSDGLHACPACHARLPTDAAAAEAHMCECFAGAGDAADGRFCPVCEADLVRLRESDREIHVEECCNRGTGGAESGVGVEDYASEWRFRRGKGEGEIALGEGPICPRCLSSRFLIRMGLQFSGATSSRSPRTPPRATRPR